MEETLASRTMAEIDLIKNLEKISSEIPNRILKVQGYILKENVSLLDNHNIQVCYRLSQKEEVRPNLLPFPYKSSYILEIFRTCLSSYGTTSMYI